ncbi:MAG: sugar transferase [Anaerohalosphaeraceae bacterium]|nr:sugar transferase [Anaerohalosphaeraceae bacterium]
MYNLCKRLLDVVISVSAILFLLPVFLLIFIALKLSDKGPAIFKQTRAGKNALPFTLYKFRTMKPDCDPFGASPKGQTDPRLTKLGIFLREYSMDELPQFFNVLKGQMSIVGPRPLYISQISEWNEHQKQRLLVKPGLTGLAQISGRGEITIEEKLALDVEYVNSACFWTDIKIVFKTAACVFSKGSIYEKRYSEKQETREN